MDRKTRAKYAREAVGALLAVVAQLDDIEQAIRDSSPGVKAATYDQPMVSGGSPSNNQTFLASQHPTRAFEHNISNVLEDVWIKTLGLSEHITQHLTLTDEADITRDPICHVTGDPVFRTGNVGKRLDQSLPLSRWVYEFVRSNKRLPDRSEVNRTGRKDIRVGLRSQETEKPENSSTSAESEGSEGEDSPKLRVLSVVR